jgi:hypothetical protein
MTALEKGMEAVVTIVVERAVREGLLPTGLSEALLMRATQTAQARAALDAAGFPMYLTTRQASRVLREAAIRLAGRVS